MDSDSSLLVREQMLNARVAAGAKCRRLKAEGYSAIELSKHFSLTDLKLARFPLNDVVSSRSLADLRSSGAKAADLKYIGFFYGERRNKLQSFLQLESKGLSWMEIFAPRDRLISEALLEAGYSLQELKEAKINPLDLLERGFTVRDLLSAGFTVKELRKHKVPLRLMRDAGVTASAMRKCGCSLTDLTKARYTVGELLAANYSETDLKLASIDTSTIKYIKML